MLGEVSRTLLDCDQHPERSSPSKPFRAVIAGGGVAAVEAGLALRELAAEKIVLTIATTAREFVYRPLAVLRPFRSRPTYRIELARIAADLDAELVAEDAVAVESDHRQILLSNGQKLSYDALLIAIGAQAEAIVGAGTFTPWDWGEGHAFRSLLQAVSEGEAETVAFIVPPGLTWPLPLYELALLTRAHLRNKGMDGVTLSIVTNESAPLEDFGREASAAVARLLEQHGVALFTRSLVGEIGGKTMRTSAGVEAPAEITVALPVIVARTLAGVPTDAAGFIPVDAYCRVSGNLDIFAAGDCTSGSLKQGGIAAQQADVAAAGIANLAGAAIHPKPLQPELHAVLLTGDTPLHLDQTGARPIPAGGHGIHPQPAEKIVARHLTPYLADATPPLQFDTG